MKKLGSLSLLFLMPILAFSQTVFSFPWGVSPKSSLQEVREQVEQSKGYLPTEESLNIGVLLYGDFQFSGESASVAYHFLDNRLYGSMVTLTPRSSSNVFSCYDDMKAKLTDKYGEPQDSRYEFLSPYYLGDGYPEQAVRMDKTDISSTWRFPSVKTNQYSVYMYIDKELKVELLYLDHELEKIKNKRQKVKEMEDL